MDLNMKIAQLRDESKNVNMVLTILSKDTPRDWEKNGIRGRVATARVTDKENECNLSLWNNQIDDFDVGDEVYLINGFCTLFEDPKYGITFKLTSGKFGTLKKAKGDAQ